MGGCSGGKGKMWVGADKSPWTKEIWELMKSMKRCGMQVQCRHSLVLPCLGKTGITQMGELTTPPACTSEWGRRWMKVLCPLEATSSSFFGFCYFPIGTRPTACPVGWGYGLILSPCWRNQNMVHAMSSASSGKLGNGLLLTLHAACCMLQATSSSNP